MKYNKLIISIVFLIGLVCLVLLVQGGENSFSSQFLKKHKLLRKSHQFYGEGRTECVKACEQSGGVNCGTVVKNCCRKDSCTKHSVLNYVVSETCQKYLAIQSCTEP